MRQKITNLFRIVYCMAKEELAMMLQPLDSWRCRWELTWTTCRMSIITSLVRRQVNWQTLSRNERGRTQSNRLFLLF